MAAPSSARGPTDGQLRILAGFALAAAALQLVAAVVVELAPPRALLHAHALGARWTYMLIGAVVLAGVGGWLLRERPRLSVLFAVGTFGLAFAYLEGQVGVLTLAIHGEPIAYHFLALLAAALSLSITAGWLRDPSFGRARALPFALASIAALLLLAEHFADLWPGALGWSRSEALRGLARTAALCTWPVAAWMAWPRMREVSARFVPLLATFLLTFRVVAAGPEGLLGATVVQPSASWLGGAFVLVALATATAMRPRVELAIHAIVGIASLGACLLFLWLYYGAYGSVEDGLADILRSLFAFDVPLPYGQQPGWWKPAVVMVGIFFLLYTVYASIVSGRERWRGVALALMCLAGLNLVSPYLVLVLAAGGLSFVAASISPGPPSSAETRAQAISEAFEGVARRLGLEAPIVVSVGKHELLKIAGELDRVAVDLRARTGGKRAMVELSVGVIGDQDAPVALVWDPGEHGQRPAHPVASNYRIEGEVRMLEELGDRGYDAIAAFRGAQMHLWEAGAYVTLANDDPAVDTDRLESLIRVTVRSAGVG